MNQTREIESKLKKYVNFDNSTPNNFWDDILLGNGLTLVGDFSRDTLSVIYNSKYIMNMREFGRNICYAIGRSF